MMMYPHLFRTKIGVLGIFFLALIMLTSGLVYWMVDRAHYHSERSRLAHNVYEEYLVLSAQTYVLYKQLVNTLVSNGTTHLAGTSTIEQGFRDILDGIYVQIGSEVAYVKSTEQNEEKEELLALANIEWEMQKILVEFERIRAQESVDGLQKAEVERIRILENRIDQDFKPLIDKALEEERREVTVADARVDALSRWLTYTVTAVAVLGLTLGGGLLVLLLRQLKAPLDNLLHGIESLAGGDLAHRLPVDGRDEFARVATGFNAMAQELEQHERLREDTRANLEHQVDETSQELRAANERLRGADQIRRQFFADISHELRTPLTVILGESQFALRGANKPAQDYKDALQRVSTQAQQLSRLVDDLLFIARAEAGAARLKRERVALDRLVGEVCADAQVLADGKAIRIAFHPSGHGPTVHGDPGRLRQLFLILLENAVHYSKPESQVDVTLSPAPNSIVARVADSGVGIAPDEQDSVFERFYRGDQAADMNAQGSGLGLPVAKAIIEAHDGEIDFDSEPDNGTTFAVTLPKAPNLHAEV